MCPAGQITEQAKAALGRDVQLHRFIITLRGRTGYLRPELEEEPIRGEMRTSPVTEAARLQRAMLTACLVLRGSHAPCMQQSFQQCCWYCGGRNRSCRGGAQHQATLRLCLASQEGQAPCRLTGITAGR